ncbi:MAG: hypothetical protein AB1564_00560 [Chloroflexota bacterium]
MKSDRARMSIEIALFFLVAAFIYLPLADQFGYYNDDWYSMYAARVAGPQIFREVYSIDRPGRALVMIPLYILFGGDPFYYSLSAYFFRVVGALSLLWLLRLLWPAQRNATLLMAFLFLIYPGFLSQPNAIDFQSHLIGICLAFLSLGLTVQALTVGNIKTQALFWLGAALTGWGYLSQMEYYIGFEAVRLALVTLLSRRENSSWKKTVWPAVKLWLPYLVVPAVYLFWRIFLFENQRPTTDVDLQFGKLFEAPLETLYAWLMNFIQSMLNVLVLAWGVPLATLSFSLDLHSKLVSLVPAAVVLAISLLAFALLQRRQTETENAADWQREALWLGLAWTLFGLLPVIFANRAVIFPNYSRYGLVSSAGAVLALVSVLYQIAWSRLRTGLVALLLFSASVTHYANGVVHANFANDVRTFWWQVSWRIPQMTKGTTMVANYPRDGIRESSFIWGPANHVYYPELLDGRGVPTGVYALLLNETTVTKVLTRKRSFQDQYNVVATYPNYRNILILTQPSVASCVQVIDGKQPVYSSRELDAIRVIGPYSEAEQIVLDAPLHVPPEFLFGTEPEHDWCYYYEKAALARQRGEWEEIVHIGEQAQGQGYEAGDLIEWMPFLEAYAREGEVSRLSALAPVIASDAYVAHQACQLLRNIQGVSPLVTEVIQTEFCVEQ